MKIILSNQGIDVSVGLGPRGLGACLSNFYGIILHMHGCVVDQKYFYTRSNACMLGAKACMHVAHVFQELTT